MKNKITIFLIVLSLMATLLAGCGSAATPAVAASNRLSTASKLALGTLKLENTSNAVTASEATQLLTLWEAYQSISSSDIISQVELDALLKQIEDTMTAAQIKAIDAISLTDQSVSETLSSLNTSNTSGTPSSTPSASGLSQSSSSAGSSGMPSSGSGAIPSGSSGGMPSGGPGGVAPGGDSSGVGDVLNGVTAQSRQTTTQTSSQTGVVQINPMLLQALIQMLEAKSQAAG